MIRVASRELTYSDEARKAEFSGGVEVESGDGSMKAEQVEVYLQPAPVGSCREGPANDWRQGQGGHLLFGRWERVYWREGGADGGERAYRDGAAGTAGDGEQLVYTAER